MERTEVINKTEKANSFCGRYAGTGTDFKIYFDTLEELINGLANVLEAKKYLATMQGGAE